VRDRALLMILNPRELPECLLSLENLDVPKVWLKRYTEWELEEVIAGIVESTPEFTRYTVISDDCVVSRDAYLSVLETHVHFPDGVVTGYCNLDHNDLRVNLTKTPFQDSREPDEGSYNWYTIDEVREYPSEIIPTYFAGMALTCMGRDMWRKFPWKTNGYPPQGWAADYNLSLRLQADDRMPVYAPKAAYVYHTKPDWRVTDTVPRRRVLNGTIGFPTEVVWEL